MNIKNYNNSNDQLKKGNRHRIKFSHFLATSVARNNIFYLLGLLLFFACKHPFDPPKIPVNNRPLVVEGFINATPDSSTTMTISRVQNLGQAGSLLPEWNAVVIIESEDGATYPLLEDGFGKYSSGHLSLPQFKNYRLDITTADGNKYLTDFVEAKKAQPIDSLEWSQNSDVHIYVNTQDPLDSTKYYRWDYVETWNYLSNVSSPWGVENRIIFAKDSLTQTDSCWRTSHSTDIITTNSLALSQDLISHFLVCTVPVNTEKISDRYSILVMQYALTKEAYQFFLTLKKNTQQTGSLFDPQPSQLPSNLHCITHPEEKVVGFVYATSVTERRIFIRHTQVQNWHYPGLSGACDNLIYTFQNPTDFRIFDYPDTTYAPYYFQSGGGLVLIKKSCTYCTYYGGSNVKPLFW